MPAIYLPYAIDDPADAWALGSLPYGARTGGDDGLALDDGAASYVEVTAGPVVASPTALDGHTFRMALVSGTPDPVPADPASDFVTFFSSVASHTSSGAGGWAIIATAPPEGAGTGAGFNALGGPVADEYHAAVANPFLSPLQMAGMLHPDTVWVVTSSRGSFSLTMARLSYLRMEVRSSVTPFLRRFNRDDGLGTSAPRQWGGTSAQRSLRRYGYR